MLVSKKVLVAINNDNLREAYSDILAKEAFTIFKTKNGKEAFEIALREKPLIILADTILEEIGGFTLLKKIREAETLKRTPVIIFSQYESSQEKQEAMQMEANDYMALSTSPPAEVVRRIRILFGEQKSYRIKVSVDDKDVRDLMESMNINTLECPTCYAKKEMVLIKDLTNGSNRFIVSFVCPNHCN
jgi:two-component system chemotaxis response regulator CheY